MLIVGTASTIIVGAVLALFIGFMIIFLTFAYKLLIIGRELPIKRIPRHFARKRDDRAGDT
jgi:hypothetical protein